MVKGFKDTDELLGHAIQDLEMVFRDDLISVTLYGSGVSAEYRPGRSDLNLLAVVDPQGLAGLDRLAPYQRDWRKFNLARPLILSPAELTGMAESFPLELLGIRDRHRTLLGPDPLDSIEIRPADLADQCRRELRSKLILLREGCLAAADDEDRLYDLALSSIKAYAAIFRGVLVLAGEDPAELSTNRILSLGTRLLSLTDGAVLSTLWGLRDIKRPPPGRLRELFRRFLRTATQAAARADEPGLWKNPTR